MGSLRSHYFGCVFGWIAWKFYYRKKNESNQIIQNVKPIKDWEPRNEVWGENYPREYETYIKTNDTSFASKHGGSATVDMLERYPDLVVLWAGYAFSRDYSQSRGTLSCDKRYKKNFTY